MGMNWFWKVYEKVLAKDEKRQTGPIEKKLNDATEKVLGPLVK